MEWLFSYKDIYNYYELNFASRYVPEFASLRAVLPRLSFFRVIPNLPSNPTLALVSQQDSLPSPRKISTCLTQWIPRQNQPFVSLWINLRNRFNCVVPQVIYFQGQLSVQAWRCLQLPGTRRLWADFWEAAGTVLAVGCWKTISSMERFRD